ncbi:MAG: DUF4258 domain-containing protein [bacterium]
MLEEIKKRVVSGDYRFTIHAFERCVERNISPNEIKNVIISGEIIENYPEDKYGPSCLICGITESGKILHVQCSIEPVWIITVYDPTLKPEEWDENFRRRR